MTQFCKRFAYSVATLIAVVGLSAGSAEAAGKKRLTSQEGKTYSLDDSGLVKEKRMTLSLDENGQCMEYTYSGYKELDLEKENTEKVSAEKCLPLTVAKAFADRKGGACEPKTVVLEENDGFFSHTSITMELGADCFCQKIVGAEGKGDLDTYTIQKKYGTWEECSKLMTEPEMAMLEEVVIQEEAKLKKK